QAFKLRNGEDIMGEVFFEQTPEELEAVGLTKEEIANAQNTFFLRNPVRIFQEYNRTTNNFVLTLIPWIPYTDDELIPLHWDDVLTPTTPTAEVLALYSKALGRAEERKSEEQKAQRMTQQQVEDMITLMMARI